MGAGWGIIGSGAADEVMNVMLLYVLPSSSGLSRGSNQASRELAVAYGSVDPVHKAQDDD